MAKASTRSVFVALWRAAGTAAIAIALSLALGLASQAQAQATTPPAACTITGTSGRDVLRGTSGPDVICGLGGADLLVGSGGSDILRGGGGADRLLGGSGADSLFGGDGADSLDGGSGHNLCVGGNDGDFSSGDRFAAGTCDDVTAPVVVSVGFSQTAFNTSRAGVTIHISLRLRDDIAGLGEVAVPCELSFQPVGQAQSAGYNACPSRLEFGRLTPEEGQFPPLDLTTLAAGTIIYHGITAELCSVTINRIEAGRILDATYDMPITFPRFAKLGTWTWSRERSGWGSPILTDDAGNRRGYWPADVPPPAQVMDGGVVTLLAPSLVVRLRNG